MIGAEIAEKMTEDMTGMKESGRDPAEQENKRLRVMALIWSMESGGAQKIVLNNLRFFQDDPDIEFRLYVFCAPSGSDYDLEIRKNHYPVVYLNYPKSRIRIPYVRGPLNLRVARRAFCEAIRDYSPDIVHVHIDELLDKTLYGIVRNHVPVRFDTLHSDPGRYHGRVLRIIRRAFQKEHFIPLCLNSAQAGKAAKLYGFKRYEILHNGTDYNGVRSRIIPRAEARSRFGIGDKTFVVCGVGRLHQIKNFPLLIRSFDQVHRKNPDSLLLLAGDGSERKNLEKLAAGLGLTDCVRFLGNQSDVVPVYCASDVLCITSFSESSSLVLVEAQLCGTRCVISNGCPEESIITDRVKRMPENAGEEQWAEEILNTGFRGRAVSPFDTFELETQNRKLKELYLKYYEEYTRTR